MKRIVVLFFLITSIMYSQTYYLNVWSKGQLTSIPISQIKKLAFSNTSTSGVEEFTKEQTLINTFELFQNYPNPFNPSTTIEYQISNYGYVEVKVFDISGKLVRTLASTNQSAGKYTVSWDGKDCNNYPAASGIYIYRVMFDNSVLSKKMLLLK